ncbi:MAG: hypothetical protein FJX11_23575 [Alphaproteobacteria bacterium]|nr:hypothetical protein [Alphaproteobacteria bacterium]
MTATNTATKLLIGLLSLGLGGCATTQERMNSWVGSTDAHLLSAWGVPDRKATTGGGIHVVTYKEKTRDFKGRVNGACHKTFTVDADHRIIAANTSCR